MSTDHIVDSDIAYRRRMEQGSEWLRASVLLARFGRATRLRPPIDLIWRETAPPANWIGSQDSLNRTEQRHRVASLQERDRRADRQRVKRDPCPLCAVRADIGCKHRRVA